jgi:hypothetical protein
MKNIKQAVLIGALTSLFGLGANTQASAANYTYRVAVPGLRASSPPPAQVPGGPFNFTPCNATGALGPTASACTTAYGGTALAGLVSVSGGIQSWTVPVTGTYTVRLAGGSGGTPTSSSYSGYTGGKGAVITTTLSLSQGTILKILVGQAGQGGVDDAGGGGASYVETGTTPLAVAGGGGGGGMNGGAGYNASVNTGTTSSHGTGAGWGGGGSGVTTNGYNDVSYGGQSYSFSNGGNGGGTTINNGGAVAQ